MKYITVSLSLKIIDINVLLYEHLEYISVSKYSTKHIFFIHSLNTTTFLFTFSEIMIRRILDQRPQSETIPLLFLCIRKV